MARIDPLKLFVPKQALRDDLIAFFSGRRGELSTLLDMVGVPGAAALVFGERGIGKTSVAWQAFRILSGSGKENILQTLDVSPTLPIRRHRCLWLQCTPDMLDLEGLLLNLIRIQPAPPVGSLGATFPELLDDAAFQTRIEQTYKIDIKVVSAEWKYRGAGGPKGAQDLADRTPAVHALFRDVMSYAASLSSGSEILIFLDDVNYLPSRKGLGHLIKNLSDARFVLVSRESLADELISEEESVNRKLRGSVLEIPGLNESETNWIFDRAEREYPNRVTISDDFRRTVHAESYGLPWAIQQFGYFAAFSRLSQSGATERLAIEASDFEAAATGLASDESETYSRIIKLAQDSTTKQAILRSLSNSSSGVSEEDEIRKDIKISRWKVFSGHLDQLVDAKILKKDSSERVRFYEPITRMLVRIAVSKEFTP